MKTFKEYIDENGYSFNDFDYTYEMEGLIEQYADEKVKEAINNNQHYIQGGKYTLEFLSYIEKFFKYRPKVYDWVTKDGKKEFTHKQLCNYYKKAMLESPFKCETELTINNELKNTIKNNI